VMMAACRLCLLSLQSHYACSVLRVLQHNRLLLSSHNNGSRVNTGKKGFFIFTNKETKMRNLRTRLFDEHGA
jgi:hypothetical protein